MLIDYPFETTRVAVNLILQGVVQRYPEGAMTYFRKFWFDTALSGGSVPLAGLGDIANRSRILFGTDYPYISTDKVTAETKGFDTWDGFSEAQRKAINRANAEDLFPRLASK